MLRISCVLSVVAILILAPMLVAADKPAQGDAPKLLEKLTQRFSLVVAKDVEEKLQLSDEQKAKLEKIQKELDAKNQKLLIRAMLKLSDLQSAFDKARNENDAEDLKTEALDIGMFTLELIKSQREIDAKFRAILSDEQKKTYDDSKRIVLPRRQPQR